MNRIVCIHELLARGYILATNNVYLNASLNTVDKQLAVITFLK